MGMFNIKNESGFEISSLNVRINDGKTRDFNNIAKNETEHGSYDGASAANFSDMLMDFTIDSINSKFHINLNRGHWFGGEGEQHYPGVGSDIELTIVPYNSHNDMRIDLKYKSVDSTRWIYSGDHSKHFTKKAL